LLGLAGEFIPLNVGMMIMPILGYLIFKLVVYSYFKNDFM
jgi:hypothetical protein